MTIPFSRCVARPDSADGTRHLLLEHLLEVARSWGRVDGDLSSQLRFLAGLTHDAGKARARWQSYITGGPGRVNHAPLGSALFAFAASTLLEKWLPPRAQRQELESLILHLARDIYDHHGSLDDLGSDVPWRYTLQLADFDECDLGGLLAFVEGHFPGMRLGRDGLAAWIEDFPETWTRWQARAEARTRRVLAEAPNCFREAAARCVRMRTAGLVVADRYHASGLGRAELAPAEATRAELRLRSFCEERAVVALRRGASEHLVSRRQWVQDEAVRAFVADPEATVYTVLLPTGLGKTLSSMRVALTACAMGRCRRVVYVAPYLSILSQATREIARATGLEVLEHHHLSVLRQGTSARSQTGEMEKAEEESEPDELLVLDSWQAPVVTTTFNQLFRGLFPQRAQHTMRLEALKRAFVIVDEPQIIDGAVWNVFLTMLEAVATECGAKVLLSTATLPPLELGIGGRSVALGPAVEAPCRYNVRTLPEPLDESGTSALAVDLVARTGSVAVILNTVADAAEVYRLVRERVPRDIACYNLTGCMTALHKAHRIGEIAERLGSGERVVAVCTQILECGVDLSFRSVLRALPVIPSIAQAAGRANRHAEGDQAEVIVFRFLRNAEEDTRRFVYRAGAAREETEACLADYPGWREPDTQEIVADYYRRVMARNTDTASLQSLVDAACGTWTSLGRVDPFGSDYPQVDVFVPRGEQYLQEGPVRDLLEEFAPGGSEQLYERYLDRRFMARLSFVKRKQFIALLRHFIVSLSPKVAKGLAEFPPEVSIARIVDTELYSEATGLAHRVGMDGTSAYFL